MKKVVLMLIILFSFQQLSAQVRGLGRPKDDEEKKNDVTMVSHSVKMGETIRTISQIYLVTPAEIYKVNKFAVDGVTPGMTLSIPVPKKTGRVPKGAKVIEQPQESEHEPEAVAESPQDVKHTVTSGETLGGIAQQYGVSVDAIKEANPKVAKRGLHADETIVIPSSGGIIASNEGASASAEMQTYKVQSGDTLSQIAENYHVSMDALRDANPKLKKRGLQSGETLKIPAE